MNNFLKFLFAFVCVILVFVYNNPEVVDKYRNQNGTWEKDSVSAYIDSVVMADTQSEISSLADTVNIDSLNTIKTTSKDTFVLDTVKPCVNVDTFTYSSKSAKAYKGSVDAFVKKTLMPYFKLEHNGDVCWYYARTAPVCKRTNTVCADHDAFYTSFGMENGEVFSRLYLNVHITGGNRLLNLTKVLIVADNQKFDVTSNLKQKGSNACFYYVCYHVKLDTEEFASLAWTLYNAKSVKVLYDADNGGSGEMQISKEELEYIHHGINMYIACGQWWESKL